MNPDKVPWGELTPTNKIKFATGNLKATAEEQESIYIECLKATAAATLARIKVKKESKALSKRVAKAHKPKQGKVPRPKAVAKSRSSS